MVGIFKKYEIKYVLLNGGNGTMDMCGRIYEVCKDKDIRVIGIPKTIDNDIAITDHAPGFGSAARYIAATTAEVGVDVKALPINCKVEVASLPNHFPNLRLPLIGSFHKKIRSHAGIYTFPLRL